MERNTPRLPTRRTSLFRWRRHHCPPGRSATYSITRVAVDSAASPSPAASARVTYDIRYRETGSGELKATRLRPGFGRRNRRAGPGHLVRGGRSASTMRSLNTPCRRMVRIRHEYTTIRQTSPHPVLQHTSYHSIWRLRQQNNNLGSPRLATAEAPSQATGVWLENSTPFSP